MTTLRYVYGIARASDAPIIASAALTGIDEGAVRCVADGALLAAVSDVDEADYGSEPLNAHIGDMDWLAPRAAQHQAVNGRLLALLGTVLPLSFGAIYRDDERVREMLREDADGRAGLLSTLDGRTEWVLTVSRHSDTPTDDEELRALDAQIAASRPGRAFLLDKRRGATLARSIERNDAEAAADALAAVDAVAERTYREPIGAAGTETVALRASLLIGHEQETRLLSAVSDIERRLGERGYRVRLSGPWPAYRFGGTR